MERKSLAKKKKFKNTKYKINKNLKKYETLLKPEKKNSMDRPWRGRECS